MKSVGEVMAIGHSFEEVLQKALRMLNVSGADGSYGTSQDAVISKRIKTIRRRDQGADHAPDIRCIAEAMRDGVADKKDPRPLRKIDLCQFLGKMQRYRPSARKK